MTTPTFVRVSKDLLVNLSQVLDVYVNPYGNVSGQLQGKSDRFSVDESYAGHFLSLLDAGLEGYREKRVVERKQREEEERMKSIRGY